MRYLPLTDADRADMLATIGAGSVDDFFEDVPKAARLDGPIAGLPLAQPEYAVEAHLRALSNRNVTGADAAFFCGAGAYRHHVPATVDHLIQRSEFLTSYTPYQPEISQGTVQALFEFQTQVAELTGMGVANASMYDGSTACAEAVLMAGRVTKRRRAVFAGGVHPHYLSASETTARRLDFDVVTAPLAVDSDASVIDLIDDDTACVVVQTPNVFGTLNDLRAIADAAHAKGALVVAVVTEVVSLGLVESPGAMGADIVVGEGQSIGNGLNFGGPYVGLFACRDERNFLRQMPGRLAGETVDADGARGFVLTLSTREQHIRRDKATSNICTNSGLCCLAFSIHMSLLGQAGLSKLARLNHARACALADRLDAIAGVDVVTPRFFNEFTVRLTKNARQVVDDLAPKGVIAGVPVSRLAPQAGLDDHLIVAATELTSDTDIDRLCAGLEETL